MLGGQAVDDRCSVLLAGFLACLWSNGNNGVDLVGEGRHLDQISIEMLRGVEWHEKVGPITVEGGKAGRSVARVKLCPKPKSERALDGLHTQQRANSAEQDETTPDD